MWHVFFDNHLGLLALEKVLTAKGRRDQVTERGTIIITIAIVWSASRYPRVRSLIARRHAKWHYFNLFDSRSF